MTLWGGRFADSPATAGAALSRSIHFDWILAPYDLRASLSHLRGLESAGLLNEKDVAAIAQALKELIFEVESGAFLPLASDEDVHSALERGLVEKIGEVGGSLRAGRSRNDQVATDLRLFTIDQMLEISLAISDLQSALLNKAREYSDAPAPGFTHMQHAQPILFGHEIAKHVHSFARDLDRIQDWLKRTSVSPLGSGALAGTGLALAPESRAADLGFNSAAANSIDAVSDRDFVAEALFILSLVGIHLSRIGEEWCIWATSEFAWAKISDSYATGSSIMPQKKNPDMAELARGKAGRLIGNLTGVLAMLKGLPFAYNRDLQEDKEPLFDSIETVLLVLPAITGMITTTEFDRAKMLASATTGFSLATEIADFLVRSHIPFAEAHEAAGKCVALCELTSLELDQLSDAQFSGIHPALTSQVREVLTLDGAIGSRNDRGATGPKALAAQLKSAESELAGLLSKIKKDQSTFSEMMGR